MVRVNSNFDRHPYVAGRPEWIPYGVVLIVLLALTALILYAPCE